MLTNELHMHLNIAHNEDAMALGVLHVAKHGLNRGLGARKSGFSSWLCHRHLPWPLASHLTLLCSVYCSVREDNEVYLIEMLEGFTD